MLNLAGVLSLQRREGDAEQALRDAIRAVPDEGALQHALALSLARQGRHAEAIEAARRAVQLSNGDTEFRATLDAMPTFSPRTDQLSPAPSESLECEIAPAEARCSGWT